MFNFFSKNFENKNMKLNSKKDSKRQNGQPTSIWQYWQSTKQTVFKYALKSIIICGTVCTAMFLTNAFKLPRAYASNSKEKDNDFKFKKYANTDLKNEEIVPYRNIVSSAEFEKKYYIGSNYFSNQFNIDNSFDIDNSFGWKTSPRTAMFSDGTYISIYYGNKNSEPYIVDCIWGQKFDKEGGGLGKRFLITSFPQVYYLDAESDRPEVNELQDGGYAVSHKVDLIDPDKGFRTQFNNNKNQQIGENVLLGWDPETQTHRRGFSVTSNVKENKIYRSWQEIQEGNKNSEKRIVMDSVFCNGTATNQTVVDKRDSFEFEVITQKIKISNNFASIFSVGCQDNKNCTKYDDDNAIHVHGFNRDGTKISKSIYPINNQAAITITSADVKDDGSFRVAGISFDKKFSYELSSDAKGNAKVTITPAPNNSEVEHVEITDLLNGKQATLSFIHSSTNKEGQINLKLKDENGNEYTATVQKSTYQGNFSPKHPSIISTYKKDTALITFTDNNGSNYIVKGNVLRLNQNKPNLALISLSILLVIAVCGITSCCGIGAAVTFGLAARKDGGCLEKVKNKNNRSKQYSYI